MLRLTSDDAEAEARALEAGQIARDVQRFLDERDARPDVFMVLRHLFQALRMNGGLTGAQHAVLVKELEEAHCERGVPVGSHPVDGGAGGVVRPLMHVRVPNYLREDV